jgi:hypothetical protein
MPIIDDGMTLEQAEEMLKAAPDATYKVVLTGFQPAEDGGPERTFQSGNTGYTVNFKITGEGTELTEGSQYGKLIKPFNAVKGTGLMAMFKAAFPKACVGTGFNTDVAVGMECLATTKKKEYNGVEQAEVQKLKRLPE